MLTSDQMSELLRAVGVGPELSEVDFHRSFEELSLDSLARVEIASRIRDGFAIDVESDITAEATPADIMTCVNQRLASSGRQTS